MSIPDKPRSHKAQKVIIWIALVPLATFAVFFIAALMGDILTGDYVTQDDPSSDKPTLGVLIGSGLCAGVLPGVFVVLLVRKLQKINQLEKQQNSLHLQDSVLELARKLGGKLTVVETTTDLDISVADARNTLDQFVTLGLARLQVSESGVLVYYFDQIISSDEKNRAETV